MYPLTKEEMDREYGVFGRYVSETFEIILLMAPIWVAIFLLGSVLLAEGLI